MGDENKNIRKNFRKEGKKRDKGKERREGRRKEETKEPLQSGNASELDLGCGIDLELSDQGFK